MDCDAVQKSLFAFADGELDDDSLGAEVARHIESCPDCRRLAEQDHRVQRALHADLDAIHAPRAVNDRVRAALETADALGAVPEDCSVGPSASGPGRGWVWGSRVLAIAASIALVVSLVWYSPPGTSNPQRAGEALARLIAQRHHRCCLEGECPHLKTPSTPTLAAAGDEDFQKLIQALDPDLTEHGFALEVACHCGVNSEDCRGEGHAVSYLKSGPVPARFSLLCLNAGDIPNVADIDRCQRPSAGGGTRPGLFQVKEGGHVFSVAMWRQKGVCYFCCSDVSRDQMDHLANDVCLAIDPSNQKNTLSSAGRAVPTGCGD